MFKIKIPNHLLQVSKGLYDLQARGEMCDLHLTSNNKTLDLHKVVLAAMGDLALVKVRTSLGPDGSCSIAVPDCSEAALQSVIRCLYLGELQFDIQDAQEILLLAAHLGLSKIATYFEAHPILKNTKSMRDRKRKTEEQEIVADTEPPEDTGESQTDLKDEVKDNNTARAAKNSKQLADKSPAPEVVKRGRRRQKKTAEKAEIINVEPIPESKETTVLQGIEIFSKNVVSSTPIQPSDKPTDDMVKSTEDSSKIFEEQLIPSEEEAFVILKGLKDCGLEALNDVSLPMEATQSSEITKQGVDTSVGGKPSKSRQKTCYKCHQVFSSAEECADHRNTCEAKVKKSDPQLIKALPFVCRKCLNRFPTKLILNIHRESCKVKRQRIERKCRRCQVTFDDLEKLRAHRQLHTAEWNKSYVRIKQSFTCDICQYKCTNEKALLTHRSKIHEEPLVGSDKHPLIECQFPGCTYRTLFQFQLKNHEFTHADDRTFICEVCGKGFKQRNVLDVHIRTVHEGPKLTCTQCGKTLKTKMALTAHIKRVHQQVKNMACPECPFRSFDATTMEAHRHSKHNVPFPEMRKSYACDVCSYSTRWKCQYDAHVRRHLGECPYKCKVCGKAFPAKSDLTSHAKWHFDKKYKCSHENCKFTTCVPGKLKNHIRTVHTHRDVKPFVCHVCDYRTNLKSNLVLHLRKVHKLKVQTKANRVTKAAAASDPSTTSTTDPAADTMTGQVHEQDGQVQGLIGVITQGQITMHEQGQQSQVQHIEYQNQHVENYMDKSQGLPQIQMLPVMMENTAPQGQLPQSITMAPDLSSQIPLQIPQQRLAEQSALPPGTQVCAAEDLLSAATKASLGKLRKPLVIQLKHPGQVITIQELQQQLQLQALQQQQQEQQEQQQQEQQQQQITADPSIQVIGTLADYQLQVASSVDQPSSDAANERQLQLKDEVVGTGKAEPPVVVEYSPKYQNVTAPTPQMVPMSGVYPVAMVSQSSEVQSPRDLMAPYASLIQVHIDSLGQPKAPDIGPETQQ